MRRDNRKIRNYCSIFSISLIIILLTSVYIPAISGAESSGSMGIGMDYVGASSSVEEVYNGFEMDEMNVEFEIQENLGVGIMWWMYDDETLANTRDDTRGFQNYLASKGFSKDFDINEDDLTKWKITNLQDQDYFEQTDFVYFAGHGNYNCISTHPDYNPLTLAYSSECSWGDEGPVKWVGLASCFNTQNHFKQSMNGINMILGWSTWCDDKQFGETLAKHCTDDEMSIKESWFATSIEKSTTRNLESKIMGENSAVGNDCIYSGGEYIEDVDVNNQITYWKCPVNHFPNIYGSPHGSSTTQSSSAESTMTEGSTTQSSTTQSSSTQSSSTQSSSTQSSSSSPSTTESQTSSVSDIGTNVRGDLSAINLVEESLSSAQSNDGYETVNNPNNEGNNYYIETNDKSVAFPTILSSAAPNLEYEKENWKPMTKQYMIDKGLLSDGEIEGVDYFMNMVPQKQGFSYKKTILGLLDPNEYFEEWDIALNVFIIKKLDGEIELPDIPDGENNILIENSEEGSSSTTSLRANMQMEESGEMEMEPASDMYQKTTLVISQNKEIGYSFTRIGSYNEDEDENGGDDEP